MKKNMPELFWRLTGSSVGKTEQDRVSLDIGYCDLAYSKVTPCAKGNSLE
jgi:hypothetical protein